MCGIADVMPNETMSFWNYNRTFSDYIPSLRKFQYQLACRSPQSTKCNDSTNDESSSPTADEVSLVSDRSLTGVALCNDFNP